MTVGAPSGATGSRLKPLLHFALLGALIFGAKQLLPQPREVIHAPDLAAADEEILVREALRLGLDRSDPVVRSRLVQNMRFIEPGTTQPGNALFEQALALGMQRSDLPVRRRLVQALHERLAADVAVGEAEIRAYVERNAGRYAGQARVSFRQVFLSADLHRDDLEAAAQRVGAQLAAGRSAAGEPFLLGGTFTAVSEADVTRHFGGAFARAVMVAPAGRWTGPLRSPYGLHFVEINEAIPDQGLYYATVRSAARYALLQERQEEVVQQALRELRGRYRIETS